MKYDSTATSPQANLKQNYATFANHCSQLCNNGKFGAATDELVRKMTHQLMQKYLSKVFLYLLTFATKEENTAHSV